MREMDEEQTRSPNLALDWKKRLFKEMRRKAIHLTGLSVPIGLILLGRDAIATAIALALAASLIIEALRLRGRIRLPEVREHERTGVAGYIYYMAGSLITVLSFSQGIAVLAMLFLIIGDSISGLVGSILKNSDVRQKSDSSAITLRVKPWPVLVACFSSCILIGALSSDATGLPWQVYLAGGTIAAIADGVAVIVRGRGLDDNLSIPVLSGAIMSASIATNAAALILSG